MSTDKTILSIIVPVYNVEQYVADCISSIYRQGLDETEFEIIIVNDGSTDKSMEIVGNFARQHTNIVIINQKNQGQAAARNAAMMHAKGEYIYFIDSDDMLADNSLNILLRQLIECGADTIQGGYIKKEDKEFPNKGITLDCSNDGITMTSGKERFSNDYVCDCYVWQNIYKKDFIVSAGLKFITGIYFEDVAYYSEMQIKANSYAVSAVRHYVYRQREGSTMSTMNKQKLIHMNMAGEHIWKTCKDIAINDKRCYNALINRIFYSTILVNYWYVTHYRNIYPYWREILNDLKQRIPLNIFNTTLKQRIITTSLKYFPTPYLWIRYKLNRKKYG